MTDAIVIGSGPNGLVAANQLADRGWSVLVLEAADEPGGAVRSGEVVRPGYVHDLYSAFYPLGAASPHIASLDLESHGLRWRRAPLAVAHPTDDGSCAILSMDIEETAASVDSFAPGDGDGWRELCALWTRTGDGFLDALFSPFPPVKAALRLGAALGPRDGLRFIRFMMLPVRRLAEEHFRGAGGPNLLAGNALHADLTPDSAAGGMFGWLLCMLGQHIGFPFPEGGAGELTRALVQRLRSRGGELRTGARVERVIVRNGRAVGVRLGDGGGDVEARRAVLGAIAAPLLFDDLVGRDHLPSDVLTDLDRFHWDSGTVKVDWALREPIPWAHPDARRAGTLHITEGMDHLTQASSQLVRRVIPDRPFLVLGQYAAADPTRAPEGGDTAWAYTHVPQQAVGDAAGELSGRWDADEVERFVDRMEAEVERLAPGFGKTILGRYVAGPRELEAANANLHRGALNAGTAQIHQQLVFRPFPGLGRPETPVRALYLAGASAHPGGGVHGGPGANAARAALMHDRARRVTARFSR